MLIWSALLSCFAVVGIVWLSWAGRRFYVAPAEPSSRRCAPDPDRLVAIKCGAMACTGARSLAGRRLLLSEAPRLPLTGCNAEVCRCRYAYFGERRGDDRRRSHVLHLGFASPLGFIERRGEIDRRASAEVGFEAYGNRKQIQDVHLPERSG
jgi:hypothetical protein